MPQVVRSLLLRRRYGTSTSPIPSASIWRGSSGLHVLTPMFFLAPDRELPRLCSTLARLPARWPGSAMSKVAALGGSIMRISKEDELATGRFTGANER
jgi:hypothetical protein